MPYIVGIDFDNTLINYDGVFLKSAQQLGLKFKKKASKKNIRDAIRQLPDGEMKWQHIQAHVYGRGMDEASLIDGVGKFIAACRKTGASVFIVSHKTQFAAQDKDKVDLRQAALKWMADQSFFDPAGLGFSKREIFFESTRQNKVNRIKELKCTHFIDDLEETFLEKSFPKHTAKILYSSQECVTGVDMTVMSSWKEIYGHFFKDGK